MTPLRSLLLLTGAAVAVAGCATLERGPVGNPAVPQPAKAVDPARYVGLWYEIGRYENGFERGCEAVTAEYTARADGLIGVRNVCRQGSVTGLESVSQGRAKTVPGSDGARFKVSFFGPLYFGDYWVLDRAEDYTWSIVGEPSGRYLWLLSRTPHPSADVRAAIDRRTRELGYDLSLIRQTRQP